MGQPPDAASEHGWQHTAATGYTAEEPSWQLARTAAVLVVRIDRALLVWSLAARAAVAWADRAVSTAGLVAVSVSGSLLARSALDDAAGA